MYEIKDDDFLTVKQVGKLLMIAPQTVRNYENDGRIPQAQRIGVGKYAKRRWYASDIMPFIKDLRGAAEASVRPDEIRSILREIAAGGVDIDDKTLTSMEIPDEPKKHPFGPVKKGSCARK